MKLTNEQINEIEYLLLNGYISVREHPTWHQLLIYTYTSKTEIEEIWDQYPTVRMCRGLVINDDTDEIIINPMPKFFNEGTKFAPKIDFYGEDTVITEKSDGYLIQIQNTKEFGLIVTSKGSFNSKYAECAKEWVKDFKLDKNTTYICELCKDFPGDEATIVTKHPNPELVLITLRDREGREYDPGLFQNSFQFTIRKSFRPEEALSYLNREVEGVVLFDRGTYNRVKMKTDWFFKMHKLISECTKKHVFELFSQGIKIKSIADSIPDEFLDDMFKWEKEFQDAYLKISIQVEKEFNKTIDLTDKELAISDNEWKYFIFAFRKKPENLKKIILRKIKNDTEF